MPEAECTTAARDESVGLSTAEITTIYHMPFSDLLHRAQTVHRAHFDPNSVQLSTLLNIKTGGCPEDCAYCPQSAHYKTGVKAEPMLSAGEVRSAARTARARGATRFCMGAAWRQPRDRDIDKVVEMIGVVREEGLESCVTLGMLSAAQAQRLKRAGLDYYNHNIDSSRSFYETIIHTRDYADRLSTLEHVRAAGLRVCCGGIIGMGETLADRIGFLHTLATLPEPPESVPINTLVRAAGTPLEAAPAIDPFDLVRTIATARILMPAAWVRLSAGRTEMSEALQALCFHAGANSIFYGEKLLTTGNPGFDADQKLFNKLGITAVTGHH
ncbi:MAG: biotin synthase BioB [Thiotrichales bacterium]|nr:biotin synthase BioB [Thiotrichales bacterium]